MKIEFYKRCFKYIDTDYFFKHCYFICQKYRYDSLAEEIEGDIQVIYKLYLKIVEFTRENDIPFDTRLKIDDKVWAMLSKPIYTRLYKA